MTSSTAPTGQLGLSSLLLLLPLLCATALPPQPTPSTDDGASSYFEEESETTAGNTFSEYSLNGLIYSHPAVRPKYGGRYSALFCVEVTPMRLHLAAVFPCDMPNCPDRVEFQYQDVEGNVEKSVVTNSQITPMHRKFEEWHDLPPDTEYYVRAVPPPNTTVSIGGDDAEGVFRTAPERPPPVQDLAAYATGVNFIALRWTPPPSLVGPCPWRLFYDIRFRERVDGAKPAGAGGWQRWVYDPESPRRRPFSTSDAFPCPAAYAGQQCAVLAQGLRPDTVYDVEVQVIDSFNISSSEVRSLIVKTDPGPVPARMQRPPRFIAATDTTLSFAADADCEPFCSGYSAIWELRNVGAKLWERHGEAVVWQNFSFTHLIPGRAYQVRTLLKRMGEQTVFADDDIPFANASTCADISLPVRNMEVTGNETSPVKIRWTRPRGSCAYTRYVIQKETNERNSSDVMTTCPPSNLMEPQPNYTCNDAVCEARIPDEIEAITKYKIGVIAINWKERCSPVVYATLEAPAGMDTEYSYYN